MFRRARPSDLEQREGRIIRQGNMNERVKIFRYVTENTFDSYLWQIIESKQKFIGQIMTSKSPVRSCEDVDETALSYAEVKALATGNPYIKEKMELDMEVSKLKLAKANHDSQKYRLEDNITQHYPMQMSAIRERIAGFGKDIAMYEANKPADKDSFTMTVAGKTYMEKKEAGAAIIAFCREMKSGNFATQMGDYLGFKLSVQFDRFSERFKLNIKGNITYTIEVGSDPLGNITRINNALEGISKDLQTAQEKLKNVERQLENAKLEVNKPFEKEEELNAKLKRLAELDSMLNMDGKDDSEVDLEDEPDEDDNARQTAEIKQYPENEEQDSYEEQGGTDELRVSERTQGYRSERDDSMSRTSVLTKLRQFKTETSERHTGHEMRVKYETQALS